MSKYILNVTKKNYYYFAIFISSLKQILLNFSVDIILSFMTGMSEWKNLSRIYVTTWAKMSL